MQNKQKKCFLRFQKKEAFLEKKKTSAPKNHQNLHFLKGVSPWFLSKNGDFIIFSFYTKWRKKKCFFEGSETKEAIGSKNH